MPFHSVSLAAHQLRTNHGPAFPSQGASATRAV
jgi:hypothetical protein